jgi:quinol-cytochrome oxidoreductase complex cytochrome b subunit
MSFWGATVITNMITALPVIGVPLVEWIWGGPYIGNMTLNRFYSLHYLLPFIVYLLVCIHLMLLHQVGSSNPLGFRSGDGLAFYPYYFYKDIYAGLVLFWFLSFVCFFYPDVLGHASNFQKANPFVTPTHIVPEWYFLPFYALLRCIPHKALGVVVMFSAIVMFFFLPLFDKYPLIASSRFNFIARYYFWFWVSSVLMLG